MEGVQAFHHIKEAVKDKDIICTDSLPADIVKDFDKFQVKKEIMDRGNKNAILNPGPPFYRGKEVRALEKTTGNTWTRGKKSAKICGG